jgi:hypothetical protein
MIELPTPPPYAFLETAAAEARAESRRFWHGKPSYPVRWKIPLVDNPERRLADSLKRHHGDAR